MAMSGEQFVEWLDSELEPFRREASASIYFEAWCSGKLSKEQVFELMKQRYAYLREIPHILAAWIQNCPYVDVQQKYIAYMHEEAPHPEYLVEFAKEMGRDPEGDASGRVDPGIHHAVFLLLAFARPYRRSRRRQ